MNRIKSLAKTGLLLTTGGLAFWSIGAKADHCTPPPTSVEANVSSKVSWNDQTKLYTYKYAVQNSHTSPLSVKRFAVLDATQPASYMAPEKWWSRFYSYTIKSTGANSSYMNWSTSISHPPGVMLSNPRGPGHPAPAYYAIKPGESLEGFSIQSQYPPAPTKFVVAGDTDVPTSTPTATNDEPVPNCPGWFLPGEKLDNMVAGLTQGPADPSVTYVAIRLRDGYNDTPHGAFNPTKPHRTVGVLVLSSKTFDATTIDPTTIQFGPGKAAPTSSKIVPNAGRHSDDDERDDWERTLTEAMNAAIDHDKDQRKNLLLTFDPKSLGLRCVFDHAVFLTGKTKDGKAIAGASKIELAGCPSLKASAGGKDGKGDDH